MIIMPMGTILVNNWGHAYGALFLAKISESGRGWEGQDRVDSTWAFCGELSWEGEGEAVAAALVEAEGRGDGFKR